MFDLVDCGEDYAGYDPVDDYGCEHEEWDDERCADYVAEEAEACAAEDVALLAQGEYEAPGVARQAARRAG